MKKALFALLLAPILFASCSKSDSGPSNEFVINGIHDVNIGTVGGNILGLTVMQSSGTQEPVTLSVTDLPAGVSADIQPASGTPAFASSITFTRTGNAAAGTFPIHIVGTSSSYTKSYDLNIIVPTMNGFVVDNMAFSAANVSRYTGGTPPYLFSDVIVNSTDNGGGTFNASLSQAFPSTDGTYTYKIGGYSSNSMNLNFSSSLLGNYVNNSADSSLTATLVISGGKLHLTIPNIKLNNTGGGGSKTLFVDVHE